MDWKAIVERKRAERSSRLPSQWLVPENELPSDDVKDVTKLCAEKGWLSHEELSITEMSAMELVKGMAAGRLTSRVVVEAFGHRSTIAQQLINPLTEINFDQAIAEASKLDEHYKQTGQVVGPLHGLPISVKDMVHVKGLDTTMGFCAWAGKIAERDAVAVAALRKAGAIVLCKTNIGHTLMMGETFNNIWGRTLNPYNRTLTSGGSSGGESALLAFRGTPIGIGTDIGGSIRMPSALCKLYGLRPSIGRFSYRGFSDTFLGQEAVRSNAGPMGNSPQDLELLMSSYMASKPWEADPDIIPIPWRKPEEVMPSGPLCFAVSWGDELVTPHPPLMRGLKHVVDALRKAGHTVVDWQGPIGAQKAGELMLDFWTADDGEDVRRNIEASGEPLTPEVAELLRMRPEDNHTAPSVYQTWQNQHKRRQYAEWFNDTWHATASYSGTGRPIDGLIMPTAPFVARPHGAGLQNRWNAFEHTYSNIQPLLDLSSGAFPTGLHQDPAIDTVDESFEPRSELDRTVHALYDNPEEWANSPIGLQIVGRRLEEEKVLQMMDIARQALDAHVLS